MHTPETRAAHIDDIRRLPEQLAAAVAGWTDSQLDFASAPGEWSARQIVHHVADSHMNAFIRLKLALSEDRPTIKSYDQDAWAEMADDKTAPVALSLELLRGLHARWAYLWERLPEDAWARVYIHPEYGEEVSLAGLLAMYSRHGREHLDQIARNRQHGGW